MVKFKLKSNPVGQVYFPKEIREELGDSLEGIASAKVFVIYPEGISLQVVLDSLEVIQKDLKHRIKLEKGYKHSRVRVQHTAF